MLLPSFQKFLSDKISIQLAYSDKVDGEKTLTDELIMSLKINQKGSLLFTECVLEEFHANGYGVIKWNLSPLKNVIN